MNQSIRVFFKKSNIKDTTLGMWNKENIRDTRGVGGRALKNDVAKLEIFKFGLEVQYCC